MTDEEIERLIKPETDRFLRTGDYAWCLHFRNGGKDLQISQGTVPQYNDQDEEAECDKGIMMDYGHYAEYWSWDREFLMTVRQETYKNIRKSVSGGCHP